MQLQFRSVVCQRREGISERAWQREINIVGLRERVKDRVGLRTQGKKILKRKGISFNNKAYFI